MDTSATDAGGLARRGPVGTRVRDRLTPKEMRIVALIVQAARTGDCSAAQDHRTGDQELSALHLRQDRVSDRLELALFTIHHRVLAQAAAEVGSKLDAEEQAAPPAVA